MPAMFIVTRDTSGAIIRKTQATNEVDQLVRDHIRELESAQLHNQMRRAGDRGRQLVAIEDHDGNQYQRLGLNRIFLYSKKQDDENADAVNYEGGGVIQNEVETFRKSGWQTKFIDDGYGEPGWYAFFGDDQKPDYETGLCAEEVQAIRIALETWPDLFQKDPDNSSPQRNSGPR